MLSYFPKRLDPSMLYTSLSKHLSCVHLHAYCEFNDCLSTSAKENFRDKSL